MIPVPLVALINACLIDMALKIELRIEYMLRILCSDLTATSGGGGGGVMTLHDYIGTYRQNFLKS